MSDFWKVSRRKAIALAAAGMTGLLSPGLALAADPALIAAAKKEGEVVWYTTLIVDQAVRPLVEAWSKKYPDIKLTFSRASSTDQAIKLMNESRAGRVQGDVFDGSSTIFPLLDAKLVEPYKAEAATTYSTDFRDPDGMWHALNAYFMVVGYNSKNLSAADVPKTWEDLLDPKFAGKIAWATDDSADGPGGFVGMILTRMGNGPGMDYLGKLARQKIAQVPANQRVTLDQVIAGEYQIGLMVYNHHIDISKGKGAPVEWAKISPAWGTRNHVGIVKGAPHPNAAKLLVEFLLSEDGQAVLRNAGYISVHPKVPPTNPNLRPDTGKFEYVTVSTSVIQENLTRWNKIQAGFFR